MAYKPKLVHSKWFLAASEGQKVATKLLNHGSIKILTSFKICGFISAKAVALSRTFV